MQSNKIQNNKFKKNSFSFNLQSKEELLKRNQKSIAVFNEVKFKRRIIKHKKYI